MKFRLCLLAILGTVAVSLTTLQFWTPLLMFRPSALGQGDPARFGIGGSQLMRVRYADGTAITGWWKRPRHSGGCVVLVVHGRSANIATRAPVMERLLTDGFGVLMFDYRGYGASSGHPSESHVVEDTRTAYQWLRAQGIPPISILVLGESLGNAGASALAAREQVGGLMLVAPYTNLPEALGQRLPWLPVQLVTWKRNRFEVLRNLQQFAGPKTLASSTSDGLVPAANASEVRKGVPSATWLDTSPLVHGGMLRSIAADGRLTKALRAMAMQRCD